jgi:hypothetical protein
MNRHSILTKTAKGLLEATGKTSNVSRELRNLLKEVDGKLSASQLQKKLDDFTEPKLLEALGKLEMEGYVRELSPQDEEPAGRAPASGSGGGGGEDLDFTAISSRPASRPSDVPRKPPVDEIARMAQTKAREESATRERAEAAARAKFEAENRARLEAEARARREAEERARREAEERAKREAAERARREAEERARREAEERARREAEERARREAAERARREAEERARREAEERERARREAEARARREAEERARREEEERARREAEERARRKWEEEERTRREEEERRRYEDQERQQREQEERELANMLRIESEVRAKREAEERSRDLDDRDRRQMEERSRREAEERSRREAEQLRRTEEDERRKKFEERLQAEEETSRREEDMRQREEEMRKREEEEAERAKEEQRKRAEEDAEAAALVNKESRDREMAVQEQHRRKEAEEKKRQKVMQTPAEYMRRRISLGKPIAITLFLLLIGSVVAIHFVPMDSAPYEKTAEEWLGQPVRVGAVYVALVPTPQIKFEKVTIGRDPQVTIASIRATPELGSLFGESKSLKKLDIEGVVVPRVFLPALISAKPGRGEAFRVERITGRRIKLDVPDLDVPELEMNATLEPGGSLRTVTFSNSERKLSVTLTPQQGRTEMEISAQNFILPIGGSLVLDDFSAKGTIARGEAAFSELEGRALDGVIQGNARLKWSDGWSLEGELTARQIDVPQIAGPLLASGRLEGKGVYAMKAQTPDKLFGTARLDGNFTIQKGSITNVDMTRVLQGSSSSGGTTLFSEMSGSVSTDSGRIRLKDLHMVAGLLQSTGNVDVDPQQNLSGRVQIELRTQTIQARATLAVSGTLKDPQFRKLN